MSDHGRWREEFVRKNRRTNEEQMRGKSPILRGVLQQFGAPLFLTVRCFIHFLTSSIPFFPLPRVRPPHAASFSFFLLFLLCSKIQMTLVGPRSSALHPSSLFLFFFSILQPKNNYILPFFSFLLSSNL